MYIFSVITQLYTGLIVRCLILVAVFRKPGNLDLKTSSDGSTLALELFKPELSKKMDIAEYFESDEFSQEHFRRELGRCDWGAGAFLLQLLEERTFAKTLGGAGKLFFLLDGKSAVSFLTLTVQDCIVAPELTPWIGFVYTYPEYRGRRYAGVLLEHARKCAAKSGAHSVYLATSQCGLYEKYGFTYLGNRLDYQNEDSRIYGAPVIL